MLRQMTATASALALLAGAGLAQETNPFEGDTTVDPRNPVVGTRLTRSASSVQSPKGG